MALVMRYLQLNYDMRYILEYKPAQRHLPPFCCLPSFPAGVSFINSCKNGVLQYSFVRTLTTMLAFVTQLFGRYGEGQFNFYYSYPYLVIINNISQVVTFNRFVTAHYDAIIDLGNVLFDPLLPCYARRVASNEPTRQTCCNQTRRLHDLLAVGAHQHSRLFSSPSPKAGMGVEK